MMDDLIGALVRQQIKMSADQLARMIDHVANASFCEALLEVDEPLWGGFWQGDVIAPGYRLPAVELTLLRATRLDGDWPEGGSVDQFLTDLRQAIRQPTAGIWTLSAAGEPCAVFAALTQHAQIPGHNLQSLNRPQSPFNPKSKIHNPKLTVVWYCATSGQLHAGYRAGPGSLHFEKAVKQREPDFVIRKEKRAPHPSSWLHKIVEPARNEAGDLPARLDAEILRRRVADADQ